MYNSHTSSSIRGWGNHSPLICSPGSLISSQKQSCGSIVVLSGLLHTQDLCNPISLSFSPSNDFPYSALGCKVLPAMALPTSPLHYLLLSTNCNGHFAISRINQMPSCLRAFALTVPSSWNFSWKSCLLNHLLIQVSSRILPTQRDLARPFHLKYNHLLLYQAQIHSVFSPYMFCRPTIL